MQGAYRGPPLLDAGINVFDVARELGGIHEGGFFETMSQRLPQVGEAREIGGEGGCELGVLFGGIGDQFEEADIGQDAFAGARDGGSAFQGYNRAAHVEGVAGGGAAAVREGVEGNVGLVVLGEVVVQAA